MEDFLLKCDWSLLRVQLSVKLLGEGVCLLKVHIFYYYFYQWYQLFSYTFNKVFLQRGSNNCGIMLCDIFFIDSLLFSLLELQK